MRDENALEMSCVVLKSCTTLYNFVAVTPSLFPLRHRNNQPFDSENVSPALWHLAHLLNKTIVISYFSFKPLRFA
jgi:hypothetical protein